MKQIISKPDIIFFDVNETLLDISPIKHAVAKILGSDTEATLWFTTTLQYSLVSTVSNQYFEFGKIGASVLTMLANNKRIPLNNDDVEQVMGKFLFLPPHKDVYGGLSMLRESGYRLIALTNSPNKNIAKQLEFAGIADFFDNTISVEDYGKYKPHSDVYTLTAKRLQVQNDKCMLIAAHGWDVAGASWAGWQSAFVSRTGQQLFPLAPQPQIIKNNLIDIAKVLIELQ